MHILQPGSAAWSFEPVSEPDIDHRFLFRAMKWTLSQHDTPDADQECFFMVFIQPPWIVSEHELDSFTECKGVCAEPELGDIFIDKSAVTTRCGSLQGKGADVGQGSLKLE